MRLFYMEHKLESFILCFTFASLLTYRTYLHDSRWKLNQHFFSYCSSYIRRTYFRRRKQVTVFCGFTSHHSTDYIYISYPLKPRILRSPHCNITLKWSNFSKTCLLLHVWSEFGKFRLIWSYTYEYMYQ